MKYTTYLTTPQNAPQPVQQLLAVTRLQYGVTMTIQVAILVALLISPRFLHYWQQLIDSAGTINVLHFTALTTPFYIGYYLLFLAGLHLQYRSAYYLSLVGSFMGVLMPIQIYLWPSILPWNLFFLLQYAFGFLCSAAALYSASSPASYRWYHQAKLA